MANISYNELNYTEIITFLSVVRTRSMSVTANELHISQPAVSKRISHLEQTYGIILFVRTKHGLQLTPARKVFNQEMQESLFHVEQAFIKAENIQSAPIHELTIGYDGYFDQPLLYEIICRFRERYAGTKVRIYNFTTQHTEDCTDLFNGTADILIAPNNIKTYREVVSEGENRSIVADSYS